MFDKHRGWVDRQYRLAFEKPQPDEEWVDVVIRRVIPVALSSIAVAALFVCWIVMAVVLLTIGEAVTP